MRTFNTLLVTATACALFATCARAAEFPVGPGETFTTITDAVAAAGMAPGPDTITVASGTYTGNLVITEPGLTITGSSVTLNVSAGNGIAISADDITLSGLSIVKTGATAGSGIEITGTDTTPRRNISLLSVSVTNFTVGLRVSDTTTVNGLTVDDSHFDHNTFGWYLSKSSANASTVTAVSVTNTSFNDNGSKGIYAEKLDHAVFSNIAVVNSGTDLVTWPPSNGVDINLKWSAYSDITIRDSLFQNGGLYTQSLQGNLAGVLVIKARDDAPSYASPAATLSNVNILDNSFTADHPLSIVGLRFGEPTKNNAGPANVTISGNTFSGYVTPFLNTTQASLSAELLHTNTFSGNAVFRHHGSSVPAVYTQIQAALDASVAGDTIEVQAGAYTGNLTLATANLTLQGEAGTALTGQISVTAPGVSIDGMEITNPSGNNGIVINGVGGVQITNNNIHHIGTGTVSGAIHGIKFGDGAAAPAPVTNITISGNVITDIGNPANANATNKGIYIGDSNHVQPIDGLNLSHNLIQRVRASRGAYGILVNHGAATTTVANNGLVIDDNTIEDLSGFWVHAIGLEAHTPGAKVTGNTLAGLTATKTVPFEDEVGIFFEANPGAETVEVARNSFDAALAYGVYVDAGLLPLAITAHSNYWGAQGGPAAGADASEGIAFTPWYTNAALTLLSDGPGAIVIQTQASSSQTGQALASSPSVHVSDAAGNPLSGLNVSVALSAGSFSSGTTTVTTNGSGNAVFADLVIGNAGTYTLTFTAAGVAAATSSAFNVTAPDSQPQPEPEPEPAPEPEPEPIPEPEPEPVPVPVPEPPAEPEPEVPMLEAVEDIIGTVVIPTEQGGESISAAVIEVVSQAATATTALATSIVDRIETVNTDTAIDALGTIGNVVSVSSNAVANTSTTGATPEAAASVVTSGATALSSFSTLLAAIDTKANNAAAPVALTPVQKSAVQEATVQAAASVVKILTAAPEAAEKTVLLESLGKIMSSNVNLGVPLSSAQTQTLLAITEQATASNADTDTQLATSVPLKPHNKELISREVLGETLSVSGIPAAELDSFLAELGTAINPADVNVGGTTGEQALAAGFADALPDAGSSISFDAATGVTLFTIGAPVTTAQPQQAGRMLLALEQERIIPGRVLSSNVVASTFPDGITLKSDGSVVITNKRIASIVVPAAHDPINLFADLRQIGNVAVDGTGNLTFTNPRSSLLVSATFDYKGLAMGGSPRPRTILTVTAGRDESNLEYFYGLTYRDGTSQVIQPFIEADSFIESAKSHGVLVAIDRNTGIVTVSGSRFRPAYRVYKHDTHTLAYWNANKDAHGLAYRAFDANDDGRSDYAIHSSHGVQLAYGLGPVAP